MLGRSSVAGRGESWVESSPGKLSMLCSRVDEVLWLPVLPLLGVERRLVVG